MMKKCSVDDGAAKALAHIAVGVLVREQRLMELSSPERWERIALMRQKKAEREKTEQRAAELAELDQLMREEAEFEAVRGGGVLASTSPESPSTPASESAPSTAAASSGTRRTATPAGASNHIARVMTEATR